MQFKKVEHKYKIFLTLCRVYSVDKMSCLALIPWWKSNKDLGSSPSLTAYYYFLCISLFTYFGDPPPKTRQAAHPCLLTPYGTYVKLNLAVSSRFYNMALPTSYTRLYAIVPGTCDIPRARPDLPRRSCNPGLTPPHRNYASMTQQTFTSSTPMCSENIYVFCICEN